MNRRRTAQFLVGCGCLLLLAAALLHLIEAYPKVSMALAASNLNAVLQGAMRAVFFMIGWTWIVIGIVTLLAAFTETKLRKPIVLFCGFALLAETPVWVRLMGWFMGNEMLVVAGALIFCGGLLFRPISANGGGALRADREPAERVGSAH